jgi:hypothetical protein
LIAAGRTAIEPRAAQRRIGGPHGERRLTHPTRAMRRVPASDPCEVAEYDDINRTVKYSHPETHPDDAMHATNYALQVAVYAFPSNRERRVPYG